MCRHKSSSLLALALCAALLPTTSAEAAKRILLENASSRRISAAVVVQTYNGWRVIGWYTVPAWSYKRLNLNHASGPHFGVYAHSGNIQWAGRSNHPVVAVVDNRMNHGVRQQPYGRNPRLVRVRMMNGNGMRFTWNGDRQPQMSRQGGGWW